MTAEIDRQPRVRFKYPVRVVPLNGQPRAWRTLSANISKKGMFLRMPEPLETGTRVALSFEAGGQVLPFAKAEVVWKRLQESKFPDRTTGFGVRFTEYLHPRAEELIGYLCENLDTGRPLNVARRQWAVPLKALGAVAAAFVLGFSGIAAWHFATTSDAGDDVAAVDGVEPAAVPDETVEASATPVAPVVVTPDAPVAVAVAAAEAPAPVETAKVEPVKAEAPTAEPVKAEPAKTETVAPVAVKAEVTATPAEDLKPLAAAPKLVEAAEAPAVQLTAEPGAPAVQGAHGSVSLPSGAAARLAWKMDGSTAHFELIGRPGSKVTKVFAMHNPERLVFDIEGSKPKKSRTVKSSAAHLSQVRIGARKDATRLVLDFADAPSKIDASGTSATVEFAAK